MSVQPVFTGRVVDGDQGLPLLDCEGDGGGKLQADLFALGVEGVVVYEGDAAERAVDGGLGKER